MTSTIVFAMKHIPSTYCEHTEQASRLSELGLNSEVHSNGTVGIEFRPIFDKDKLLSEVEATWFSPDRLPRILSFTIMSKQALAALELFETQHLLLEITKHSAVKLRQIKNYKLRIRKYMVNGERVIRLNYSTPQEMDVIDVDYNAFMRFFTLILS